MKKFVIALLSLALALPLTFAQTTTNGLYSGTVAERCIVTTELDDAALAETGADSDLFVTELSGDSDFGFRSNSDCTATLGESLDANPANGTGSCLFGNGTETYGVTAAAILEDTETVFAKVTQTQGILLAGSYDLTCEVTLSTL